MSARNHAHPVNAADKAARQAFRELLKRDGVQHLSRLLQVNERTVQRIGVARDVPPGMALDLARYLLHLPMTISRLRANDPPPERDWSLEWARAFERWANHCRQRKDANHG